ncbi:MAG: multidrug effflux MFS transporter, partial [Alphaproteobacteria bacterium]|nr:multidrug effflux MFS transporter [Alphaproteobacteria bacterium]
MKENEATIDRPKSVEFDVEPSLWFSILLTALTSMGVLSVTLYVPSMAAIAKDFAVHKIEVQVTLSLFLAGFAVGQLLYGPLSDQFGRRKILLGGLSIYVLSSIFCAIASDVEALQIARLFQGIGACCGAVIARAVIRDVFPSDRAVGVFAFIGTALSLTPAIAPIIGGYMEVWLGWRAEFWFLTCIGAAMFLWAFLALKETNLQPVPGAVHPIRLLRIYGEVMFNIRFVSLVMISTLLFCGLMSYTTISPFLMLQELGLTPDQYGMLIMYTAASYGLGSFVSGKFINKVGLVPLMVGGPVISFLGAFLMWYWGDELSVLHLVFPAMLFLFGNGVVTPPTMAAAMRPFPHIAGSASAMMGAFQMGFVGLASALVNSLYDATAIPLAYVMMG